MKPARRPRARDNPRTIAIEVAILVAISLYYILGNQVFEVDVDPTSPAPKEASDAHMNAYKLWEFEKRLGIAVEKPTQEFLSQWPAAMYVLVFFYAGPHFVLTYGFIAWTYWYRFESFAYVRNSMLLITATAFAFEWAFPVAPPRLVTDFAMVDTVKHTLPINNSTPWINALVNDYAGFPSVHTSWALVVAYFMIRFTHSKWRWIWIGYPAMIVLSITATANHVVWDPIGAVAWVAGFELVHHQMAIQGRLPRFLGTPRRSLLPPAAQPAEA